MPDGSQTPGRDATTPWRYLDLSYQDGATQLATTEAVIDEVARGAVPPTLRVYSWSEPVVILGVGQRASEIDRDVCAARGYRVLRRISGGTAVFQDARQISLEAIVPVGVHPMAPNDVLTSYERFAQVLQAGMARLGITSHRISVASARAFQLDPVLAPACFAGQSPNELTIDARKLIGLAQIRRRGVAVLQAALYLRFDPEPLAAVTRKAATLAPGEWAARLSRAVVDIGTAAGRPVDAPEVVAALRAAFQRALDDPLERGDLTPVEQAATARLVAEKYRTDAWTYRR